MPTSTPYPSRANPYDACVVGAGPNGLAAALTLASKGLRVVLFERSSQIGGGTRTEELTLPGFHHDVCSAIHPMGLASPFFRKLPLEEHGLEWIHPPYPFAHPLDGGDAVIVERSLQKTAQRLGDDGPAYMNLLGHLVHHWDDLDQELLGPLSLPRNPIELARFGMRALMPAAYLLPRLFREEPARAMLAGCAAHTIIPLTWSPTMAAGMIFPAVAHRFGWPLARGGSQSIANAMASLFRSLGGEIVCDHPVEHIDDLPPARIKLLDVSPRQLIDLATGKLGGHYARQLANFRYAPGVFKVDYALDGPVPWTNPELLKAGTVHLGATLEEITESERAVWAGANCRRPFVLIAQQSLFDSTRAPAGKHTLWAYCHVPHNSPHDCTEAIENQIERFAPGFRKLVLKRVTRNARQLQTYNPNYIGGDVSGGAMLLSQLFTRPVAQYNPYATPLPGVYLCSSSTPPGGGVHGMCGHHAALSAYRREYDS